MLKQIKKVLTYGLVGLTLGYGIACGRDSNSIDPIVTENQRPVIVTDSLEDAVTGEYYEKEIEVSDADGDILSISLVSGPEWMKIEGNKLKWSPRYGKDGGIFPYFSQTGTYDVIIGVSDGKEFTEKNLTLIVNDNFNTYDFYFIKSSENIREMSGDNNYLSPFNENTLDEKFVGMNLGIKELQKITEHDAVNQLLPVEIHLLEYGMDVREDPLKNVCRSIKIDGIYIGGYQTMIERDGVIKGLICLFRTIDTNGNILSGPWPVYDIRNQVATIHEYIHLMFRERVEYNPWLEEPFAYSLSNIITRPDLNSFCDASYGNYSLLFNLCNNYYPNGFDVDDLPEFFDKVDIKKEEKGSLLDEQDIKCIMDGIVSKKRSIETNTAQDFYDSNNDCNIGNCFIIEDEYCGDF